MTKDEWPKEVEEILVRLGPGAFPQVDEVWLNGLFGFWRTGRKRTEEKRSAKAFASDNKCFFRYDSNLGMGIFGRAYPKKVQATRDSE